MRRNGVILGLAMLNVVLLAVVLWQARHIRAQRAEHSQRDPSSSATAADSAAADQDATLPTPSRSGPRAAPASSFPAAAVATNWPRFDWRVVESDDYETYVKNLRAIGCPEATIKDIVQADVAQAFQSRRAEAAALRYGRFQFNQFDDEADATFARRRHEVDAGMNDTLRQLLGNPQVAANADAGWRRAILEQQLNFLPAEKQQSALEIFAQWGDADISLPRGISGNRLTATQAEELQARVEGFERRREELQRVLTPEEYEHLEMITSWTGNNLRQAMARFEPSEAEFTAIFREWRAHDERIAALWANGEPDPGNNHVFANIQNILGPERYKLYRETWWK